MIIISEYIIIIGVSFVLFAILIILSRYISRPITIFTSLAISIISIIIFIGESILINILIGLTVFIMCSISIFAIVKIEYNLSGKFISLSYIINKISNTLDKSIAIGTVMPYSLSQLKYNGKMIPMNDITAAGGILISGSTGSGKTHGIKSIIKQRIEKGQNIVFTEYKGDKEIIDEIGEFAKSKGYSVFRLSNGESNFNYDPLKNLNNVGRIEAIINMRKWSLDGSDAHYRTSVQLLLQKLIKDFSHLYNSDKEMQRKSYTLAFQIYVKEYNNSRDEWEAYATISKLLELLITSDLSDMFSYRNEIDLDFSRLKGKYIVLISFPSSNKELATSFSSLLFKDILDEFTTRSLGQKLFVFSDEFGTLENPFIIKDLIEKGRSAGISISIALQDINQIVIQTNEAYLNSLLGTINTFIIYSGATRVTAEKLSGVQIQDIDMLLMSLKKPIDGKPPTAIYISKYPSLNKRITSEVFRFVPYTHRSRTSKISERKPNIGVFEREPRSIPDIIDSSPKIENLTKNQNKESIDEDRINYNDFI